MTRLAILQAARDEFASCGYTGATIRAIARAAAVDPALVHHHYGTKEDLFVAAHDLPVSPGKLIASLDEGPGTPGARLARAYLGAGLADEGTIASLLRSAATAPAAAEGLRQFIEHSLLGALERRIGGPDGRLRAALAASHLVGIMMLHHIIGVQVITEASIDDLVAQVAPALDRYLAPAGTT